MSVVLGWIAAVFGAFGACCLILALIPPFVSVWRTRKTFGLSPKLLFFASCAGLIFFVIGIFIVSGASATASDIMIGTLMIVSNIISCLINYYLFLIKVDNMSLAKKHHMSEMDYHFNVVEPMLKLKNKYPKSKVQPKDIKTEETKESNSSESK